MDSEGYYWSAGVSAGRLNRFAPDGCIIEVIELPVQAPTMPAFGQNGTVFVTSHRRIAAPTPIDGAIVELQTRKEGVRQKRFHMTEDAGDMV